MHQSCKSPATVWLDWIIEKLGGCIIDKNRSEIKTLKGQRVIKAKAFLKSMMYTRSPRVLSLESNEVISVLIFVL